jgi:hypothetical protein
MATAKSPAYKLNNGIEMPALGLGVFHVTRRNVWKTSMKVCPTSAIWPRFRSLSRDECLLAHSLQSELSRRCSTPLLWPRQDRVSENREFLGVRTEIQV